MFGKPSYIKAGNPSEEIPLLKKFYRTVVILINLLRISQRKVNNSEISEVLKEFEQRILSMGKVQSLLHLAESYDEFDIAKHLKELLKAFDNQLPEYRKKISVEVPEGIILPSKSAVHFGLLLTEIFINSMKYSLPHSEPYYFKVYITNEEDDNYRIFIKDSGNGFNFEQELDKETTGLSLISGLVDDLEFSAKFPTVGDSTYEFEVDLKS